MTTQETALADGVLGRHVDYPQGYDAALLFPIARALSRHALGIHDDALPFIGHDRWHAYELSWLDAGGKPRVATATFEVPAHSPNLVESKSLKLYLNSFNASRFASAEAVRARIAEDLSRVAGAPVQVAFGLPGIDALDEDMFGAAMHVDHAHDTDLGDRGAAPPRKPKPVGGSVCIDVLDIAIDHYGPPRAEFISAGGDIVEETLTSALLKSNCPVTGQPDWARLIVTYRGPRLDRAGLLRYLVSFRDHAEFHEQCVERVYTDLLAHARPQRLSVEARYTRRGGLDINPWRATPGCAAPVAGRDERQ